MEAAAYTNFYACYLLQSHKEKFEKHCYIGSTPDPIRRIRQHNGEIKGGAVKTVKKRPWRMVIAVHGFPNKYAALQFEWAWQHPHLSRHFRDGQIPSNHPSTRKAFTLKEKSLMSYKLVVLSEMLHTSVWRRWPLKILFTSTDVASEFAQLEKAPPVHISINIGPLETIAHFVYDNDEMRHLAARLETMNLHKKPNDCVICMEEMDVKVFLSYINHQLIRRSTNRGCTVCETIVPCRRICCVWPTGSCAKSTAGSLQPPSTTRTSTNSCCRSLAPVRCAEVICDGAI
jgi:predicted GIY-YIG superfamily endonuclease